MNLGFEVTRNPLALAYKDLLDENSQYYNLSEFRKILQSKVGKENADVIVDNFSQNGVTKPFLREWYFATSNNLITEVYEDKKTVFMPHYGFGNFPEFAAIDDANIKIWQDREFKVISLGDYHSFASNLGAAHCITKYMGRENLNVSSNS